jgi:hypothetical protein
VLCCWPADRVGKPRHSKSSKPRSEGGTPRRSARAGRHSVGNGGALQRPQRASGVSGVLQLEPGRARRERDSATCNSASSARRKSDSRVTPRPRFVVRERRDPRPSNCRQQPSPPMPVSRNTAWPGVSVNLSSGPLNSSACQRARYWASACRAAALDGLRFHELRSVAASAMVPLAWT